MVPLTRFYSWIFLLGWGPCPGFSKLYSACQPLMHVPLLSCLLDSGVLVATRAKPGSACGQGREPRVGMEFGACNPDHKAISLAQGSAFSHNIVGMLFGVNISVIHLFNRVKCLVFACFGFPGRTCYAHAQRSFLMVLRAWYWMPGIEPRSASRQAPCPLYYGCSPGHELFVY